ncbi:Crp/Fnr family transcriptional regulator [Pseudogemmobacter sp. W21_MBD1_M6]|uniref:Crp/Fnr family transcriptional regulator n=1 Tax=Pseudogemmobacter sp. W21_MBD1_M6 TaxID=3240271 RepID=UPI003F9BC0CB
MISPETRDKLVSTGRIQDFPANGRICDEDNGPAFVGVVISGYLRFQRHGMDGRRQILSLEMAGDIIGDSSSHRAGYAIEAATDVRVCRFDKAVFDRLMVEEPDLVRAVYKLRMAKLERLRWLTWSLGALSAQERLCSFFAMATNFMAFEPDGRTGGILHVDLPRSDIADLLGVSMETISRIAKRLHEIGALRTITPYKFEIPDLPALVEMGQLEGTFDQIQFPHNLAASWGRLNLQPGAVSKRMKAVPAKAGPLLRAVANTPSPPGTAATFAPVDWYQ